MSTKIVTISTQEVHQLVKQIKQKAGELAEAIRKLRDSNGWKVLGYESWASCCESEFGYSKRHANRLIQSQQVIEQVGHMCPSQPNDRQASELARLPEEQRADCWQDYVEECQQSNEQATAAGLRALVDLWLADDEPVATGKIPKSKAAWHREIEFGSLKRLPEDQRLAAYQDAQDRDGCGQGKPLKQTVDAVVALYEADNGPIDLDGDEGAQADVLPDDEPVDGADRADEDGASWEAIAAPWRERVPEYGAAVVAARLENLADEIRTQ